ncbi:RNA polymerase TFIIH complex subunit Ssl1 [Pyricularia oryzae 70-15]|uniref:General transcription and DNA repair factor IIH n=3 Tax=Pyricularia oryzae TaxID=318829 RepID=G4ML50_PYRO7|nr:RNA polymerase TFIIH complex subunit Ssl1 [Pyricularia oryzae 70-15]EHA56786.1 RNA polymerase TFIIH complex subunit Ssl1 [Pyricularia oryzae 70-15]ELQ38674.1 suppressor of stem-loop protein 1 [Pyricularia oryzae Y34]KAI7920073.1 RNA polymerase TFIIH complex subunit Ssl1 [Pyricularia oryzae]KAI7927757.1 RNA polymerase TFIIH complex subunit Ssl1 [Pyricularia oryzae]
MADSDGEFVVDDGSDDELVAQSGGARGAAGGGRSGKGGDEGGKRRKKASKAAWEDLQRSWDVVHELDDGNLSLEGFLEAEKRRRVLRDTTPIQRGIIRHLVLVIDMSFAMAEKDLMPTRHRLTISYAIEFVREYFDQNPISQLAIVGMRDSIAVRISDLSGNPAEHIEKLRALPDLDPSGSPSLQNALEMCRGALFNTPSHGTREVVIIFGALLSLDPGDIHETIDGLMQDRIRVSVIGLAAQVYICEEICRRTNSGKAAADLGIVTDTDGSAYNVALHEVHFRELLMSATRPPVTRQSQLQQATGETASLLMMGFPSRKTDKDPALCSCHNRPVRNGFLCTRCGSRVCRLPSECPACGLTLILSTHLARSYHHLFPLKIWSEVPWNDAVRSVSCFACHAPFPDAKNKDADKGKDAEKDPGDKHLKVPSKDTNGKKKKPAAPVPKGVSESGRYMCQVCRHHFCIDCDVFSHEVLHNCPGCQSDTRGDLATTNGKGAANGSVSNGVAHDSNGAMAID